MIKVARHLVGWSQAELAEHSGLSVSTVRGLEDGRLRRSGAKLEKLRRTFAEAGVTFTNADGQDCVSCRGGIGQGVVLPLPMARAAQANAERTPRARGECVVIPFPRRKP